MLTTRKIARCSVLLGLGLCSLSATVFAGPLDFYYQQHLEKSQETLLPNTHIIPGIFQQRIDHDHPALGTFAQRYYIDETYADSSNSPVFFYICGEAVCRPSSLNGAIREVAKQYHARMVALEHRYYGESLPRPTFSATDLKYLTTDFALRDLAAFQLSMTQSHHWTGKWIAFGGSYPGSLSAYYRLKYPDLVAGSLASSAPVQAKENFEEYDAHVTKVAGPECAAKMRLANQAIESAMQDEGRLHEMKRLFGIETLRDNSDFLFMVADIGSAAVQYGYKPIFCKMLTENSDPIVGYAAFAQYLYQAWHIADPMSLATQGAESENPADYADGLGMRQWYYQSCTEYGYWQNAHHDATQSTRSYLVNQDYFSNVCRRLFGIQSSANTAAINQQYYFPLLNESTSHIFFTNGSTDPWSLLSLSATNGNATNKNLHYTTIEGAAHCDDLHAPRATDTAALVSARLALSTYLSQWLTSAQ